jgi:hypothetical protein
VRAHLPLASGISRLEVNMRFKPRIAVDFDGVLHQYISKWTVPEEVLDDPVEGAKEAVQSYIDAGFEVVVMSCRAKSPLGMEAISKWLHDHGFPRLRCTGEKVGAVIYIDDRGYRFDPAQGFPTPEQVHALKPWNKLVEHGE